MIDHQLNIVYIHVIVDDLVHFWMFLFEDVGSFT